MKPSAKCSRCDELSWKLHAASLSDDEQISRLERAGASMANILYNLAQASSWPPPLRESMKQAQEEWDAALSAVRQS